MSKNSLDSKAKIKTKAKDAEKSIIDFDDVLKNDLDKRLKVMANHDRKHDIIDIDTELSNVSVFFKEKIPTISEIVDLLVQFKKSRKTNDLEKQITTWNKFLTKFIEFDLAFEISGEKIRKISHELVMQAETLHIKSDVFKDIENKSELI